MPDCRAIAPNYRTVLELLFCALYKYEYSLPSILIRNVWKIKKAKKEAAESTILFCSGLCIACLALCKRHSHSAFHWACHSWCGMLQPRSQFVICLLLHWNLCQAMENMVGMNGNLSTARSLSAKIRKTTYWVELFCYYVTIPIFHPQFLLSRKYLQTRSI